MDEIKLGFYCPDCEVNMVPSIRQTGSKIGVYCGRCDKWIRWVNNGRDMREIINSLPDLGDKTYRWFRYRYKKPYVVCGDCNALLYDTNEPPAKRWFDLTRAKFCPNCGKEFI